MLRLLKKRKNILMCIVLLISITYIVTLYIFNTDCARASNLNMAQSKLFDEVEYAVLILSSPSNEERRNTIRATWANLAHNIIIENGEKLYRWNYSRSTNQKPPPFFKLLFVIGTQNLDDITMTALLDEDSRTKDILFLNSIQDKYKNLSLKMLHTYHWVFSNLGNLKYLVKCDDDSFVRIDLIIKDLESFAPEMNALSLKEFVSFKATNGHKGLYWGYFDGRAKVYQSGKWQELDWFLCDNYLPYALGGGYVISKNIVDYIGRNYNILSRYNSEDVSMAVWTAALDGINRVHDVRFDTLSRTRGCKNNMVIRHKQSSKMMFELYKTLGTQPSARSREFDYRMGKKYGMELVSKESDCHSINFLPFDNRNSSTVLTVLYFKGTVCLVKNTH